MKFDASFRFAAVRIRGIFLVTGLLTGLVAVAPGITKSANAQSADPPANQWNQWRGVNRNSKVTADWPEKLDQSNFQKVWSQPFSESYSGPIVYGDTIITTETKDKKYEIVTALNKTTGEKIWSVQWEGSITVPFFAARNGSWIRATPATDGQRVYVPGIRGLLVCLDFKTGKEIWKVDLNARYKTSPESFGHVCSPLLIPEDQESTLYIQCSAGFVKLDRATGKEIWSVGLGKGDMMSGGAFSSPIVAAPNDNKQIVIQTRNDLAGIEISSGKVLWRKTVPSFRGMNILTPTVKGNTFFTSSYNNKSFAYDLKSSNGQTKLEDKWESSLRAYMSSPVLIDGNVYVHLQNKQMACFNLDSGKTNWVSKQRTRFGDYMSMVACEDQILGLDSKGVLYLFKADPTKFQVLGQVDLETKDSWAHLAVDGDLVFVRGLKSLTAYRWK